VATEVHEGKTGHYFALCGECMTRIFLNTWEPGWGFTMQQVELQGCRIVGLAPVRRMQLAQSGS